MDPENPPRYHLLAASSSISAEQMEKCFEQALEGGYGKYKSRGKGYVTVEQVKQTGLPAAEKPNAVLLTGPCVPASDDPADGYWDISTRYGKLGGDWAVGPGPTGEHNPYKRPITMLQAGTVLKTDEPKPFYGQLLGDVHQDFEQVRHYAIAPAIAVHCEFEEAV